MSGFPAMRLRRLRRTEAMRRMLNAPLPGPEKFVWPIFVTEGRNVREPIDAMPGQSRLSVDNVLRDLEPVAQTGIGGVLLFGLAPEEKKDAVGSYAYDTHGGVQQAITAIKQHFPDLVLMTDVCVCAYTTHGHCGPLDDDGSVLNDSANEVLAQVALSHAVAGADVVAPSAMMDGQVDAIRTELDDNGFEQTVLMSYSTKFASAMYGPFRDAEKSAPQKGDRQGYQSSCRDLGLAMRESELDEEEGADILMVKPALFYLDVIARLREETYLPLAAYNVSGEYSMLIASADRGWGDLGGMVRESIAALHRAGTDIFISYWANQYDQYLR